LCGENNLLDVSTNTGFDDGAGLSYGSPSGMGLLNGANNAFGGFIWNTNTAGLTLDQICMFIDFDVIGDATAFPITLEFRIENGNCGFFPCPWIDFNVVINGPGMYTLGGVLSSGNVGANGPFDPNGSDTFIVAAIANFSGTPLAGDINVVFNNLCISDGNCVIVVDGCTDSTACNFDPNATNDDGSCQPVPTCNIDICAGDTEIIDPNDPCACIIDDTQVLGCTDAAYCEYNPTANCDDNSCVTLNQDPGCDDGDCANGLESWDTATCSCITTPPTGINGCTDATFCEYDPNAGCDDGSCATALPTAATISGGPFNFCVDDGTPDFVSGITTTGGTGTNAAWVVTDDQLNILGLPGMPGDVDFDGAGGGTCLIWYVTFEDITGAEVGMNAGNLGGCFALSNSIEVVRDDCGPCEEEITGVIVAGEGCDLSGITISIISADGMMINVVTEADGTFTVPGGPFPCGDYTAAFFDLDEVPLCYEESGSTDPIGFTLNGDEDGNVDFAFIANPNIPTLSQWGLIVLALLLMCIGSVSLMQQRIRKSIV